MDKSKAGSTKQWKQPVENLIGNFHSQQIHG